MMIATGECACGARPPDDPNPDCERCTLIVHRVVLLEACEALLEAYDAGYQSVTYGFAAAIAELREALDAVKGEC